MNRPSHLFIPYEIRRDSLGPYGRLNNIVLTDLDSSLLVAGACCPTALCSAPSRSHRTLSQAGCQILLTVMLSVCASHPSTLGSLGAGNKLVCVTHPRFAAHTGAPPTPKPQTALSLMKPRFLAGSPRLVREEESEVVPGPTLPTQRAFKGYPALKLYRSLQRIV